MYWDEDHEDPVFSLLNLDKHPDFKHLMAVLTHLSSPQSSLWTLCGMAGSVADRLVGVWWRLASSGAGDQLLAGQVAANWLLASCLNIYQLLAGCAAVYLLLPGCGMETGCWYTDWFVLTLGHWVAGSELVTPKKNTANYNGCMPEASYGHLLQLETSNPTHIWWQTWCTFT